MVSHEMNVMIQLMWSNSQERGHAWELMTAKRNLHESFLTFVTWSKENIPLLPS